MDDEDVRVREVLGVQEGTIVDALNSWPENWFGTGYVTKDILTDLRNFNRQGGNSNATFEKNSRINREQPDQATRYALTLIYEFRRVILRNNIKGKIPAGIYNINIGDRDDMHLIKFFVSHARSTENESNKMTIHDAECVAVLILNTYISDMATRYNNWLLTPKTRSMCGNTQVNMIITACMNKNTTFENVWNVVKNLNVASCQRSQHFAACDGFIPEISIAMQYANAIKNGQPSTLSIAMQQAAKIMRRCPKEIDEKFTAVLIKIMLTTSMGIDILSIKEKLDKTELPKSQDYLALVQDTVKRSTASRAREEDDEAVVNAVNSSQL